MCKQSIINALLGIALLAGSSSAVAQPPELPVISEVVGTLQDWDFDAGYVVVDGVRYPVSGQVEVVNGAAVDSSAAVMRRGQHVGIVEAGDGRIIRVVIFPSGQGSLQRYGR